MRQAVGARRKAGLSISPLDLSVSLPKIHHLDGAERPADSMAPPEATGMPSGFGLAPEEARPGQLQGIAEETTLQRNSLGACLLCECVKDFPLLLLEGMCACI